MLKLLFILSPELYVILMDLGPRAQQQRPPVAKIRKLGQVEEIQNYGHQVIIQYHEQNTMEIQSKFQINYRYPCKVK